MAELKEKLRDLNLPFLFEVWRPGASAPETSYILPINPETYQKTESPWTKVTPTLGGVHVDRAGRGLPRIMIQGTFGHVGTLRGIDGKKLSKARAWDNAEKSGWGLFKDFEAMFLDFYERFGTVGGRPEDPPNLYFYDFTDEDYLLVDMGRFELKKGVRRRFLYEYTLQMTGLRRLDDPPSDPEDVLDQIFSLESAETSKIAKELSLWGKLLKGYTWAAQGMSDVVNRVEAITDKVRSVGAAVSSFRQGMTDLIEAPFGLVSEVLETADDILEDVISVKEIPHEFTDLMRRTKRDALRLSIMPDLFSPAETYSVSSASASSATEGATEVLTAALPSGSAFEDLDVVEMLQPEDTLLAEGGEWASTVAAREVSILGNDTLESLAHRVLGTGSSWRRLAELNDLEYPFIVPENSLESLSDPLQEGGSLYQAADGDGRVLGVNDLTSPEAGQVVAVVDGGALLVGDVESTRQGADGLEIVLVAPLGRDAAEGAVVSVHERRLDVLTPGAKIKVPGEVGVRTLAEGDVAKRLYGADEYMVNGSHLGDKAGGLAVVGGIDNLQMQLQHRLDTVRGELGKLGHPNYGSLMKTFVGRAGLPMWFERARLEAKIVPLQDPRIRKVLSVDGRFEGGSLLFDVNIEAINDESPRRIRLVVNQ